MTYDFPVETNATERIKVVSVWSEYQGETQDMNRLRTLSTQELQQGLDRDGGLHVLNVQTDRFFAGELIPGSCRLHKRTGLQGRPERRCPSQSTV